VALHFPARVIDDLTLGPTDESPTDSPLGVRADIGFTGFRICPSKPRIGEIKLLRTCICIHKELILKGKSLNR
jgi:hypothetical protein